MPWLLCNAILHLVSFCGCFPYNIYTHLKHTNRNQTWELLPYSRWLNELQAFSNLIIIITKQNTELLKPRPNALDFSLYIARQMSSIVECCREGVAKRSRLFTRLGTQHSTDALFDE